MEQSRQPITFNPMIPTSPVHPEEEEEPSQEDVIPMSKADLEELCRSRQLSLLPDGVRRFVAGKQQVDDNGGSGYEIETTIRLGSPERPEADTENLVPLATREDRNRDVADQTNLVNDELHGTSTIQPHTIPLMQPFRIEPPLPSPTPCRESRTLSAAENNGNSCPIGGTAQSTLNAAPILLRRNDNRASPKPKRKFGSTVQSPAQVSRLIKPTKGERIEAQKLFPELIQTQPNTAPVRPSVELQPDGFYKIHVGYSTCIDMAKVCKVNSNAVIRTVDGDNAERAAVFTKNQVRSDAGPSRL